MSAYFKSLDFDWKPIFNKPKQYGNKIFVIKNENNEFTISDKNLNGIICAKGKFDKTIDKIG